MSGFFVCFRYASAADYMSTDDLLLFLEAEQGVCNEIVSSRLSCHYM